MIGQAYENRRFWEPMQQGNEAASVSETKHSRQTGPLGNKIQQLLGDDTQPDPLFFEESWTLGLAVAVRNQRQRWRQQTARKPLNRAVDVIGTIFYMQQEWQAQQDAAAEAQRVAAEKQATEAETQAVAKEAQNAAAEEATTKQATEDPFARVEAQEAEEWKRFAEARASLPSTNTPMTPQLACQMLGISKGSSQEQVKTAYRRMVTQWHPDRLQHKSEEVRRLATEQMVAINQAYHLLREDQQQRAA